jgi:hypothetical protein
MDAESLLWHRELQYLRAAAKRRIPAERKNRYMATRARKLREAQKIVAKQRNTKNN